VAIGAEEGEIELMDPVGDDGVEHPALALAHRPGRRAVNPGYDRDVLALDQTGQVGQLARLAVTPGDEVEQVADGVDASMRGQRAD
jgi:hypothetical protein